MHMRSLAVTATVKHVSALKGLRVPVELSHCSQALSLRGKAKM